MSSAAATGAILRGRAARYLGDAARGLRSAPVEVLTTLAIALGFSWATEIGDFAFEAWAELAIACLLLLAVAWTATLLHAMGAWDAARRWVFTVAGALVVGLYAIAVVDFTYEAEGWRAALLVGGAVLWLVALPAFGGADERIARMRRVDSRILLRAVGGMLYGGALFGGLALALVAVDTLFELDLDEELYGHVFGWIFFALVPWIVLGGLPDYVRPAAERTTVGEVAQRIALWLVPPLLALYFAILYAYLVRIVSTAEIPKNLVSPLVLAAGVLAAVSLVVFDPRPGERGLARWLRLTPPLFLPLAVLGAWALWQRIDQYGLTEFRVARLVVLGTMALLAVLATVQLARRRRFGLHAGLVGMAAALLLCAVGPWSALALSRADQRDRLDSALRQVGIAPADSAYDAPADTARRQVPTAAYERIRGSARYLAAGFGPEALPPVLRDLARRDGARWVDYAAELGLRPDSVPPEERMRRGGALPSGVAVSLAGRLAYRVAVAGQPARRIAFRLEGRLLHVDAESFVRALDAAPPAPPPRGDASGGLAPARAVLTVEDTTGAERGQLLVWHVWLDPDTAAPRVARLEGIAVMDSTWALDARAAASTPTSPVEE